jgi:predicted 3-demethylubiquinone-9 3-methyltransferase (glyoxalase superfamily)
MSKITPHLWFDGKAEEAAKLYVSLVPGSRIDGITTLPAESPSGPPGSVRVVDFTLAGQSYTAFDGGPFDPFNHAISFMIHCEDQAEIERIWEKLSEGGTIEQCGWLKDRFGVSWQIVPKVLGDMMKDPDRARAKRVAEAMLKMVKLDVAALQRAYDGKA